jgi:poly-gamma-glutamate capsule biosynthesis protein CapA/YwtB (metallophosphatase superfamily)
MAKKLTPTELKFKVQAAMERQQHTVTMLAGSKNPQAVEMVAKAAARVEAFEAVLAAMNGDAVDLNILGHYN